MCPMNNQAMWQYNVYKQTKTRVDDTKHTMDTLGIEPRTLRMQSGCDTTTPCAQCKRRPYGIIRFTHNTSHRWTTRRKQWTHWGLNPRPPACCVGVIPLHYEPNSAEARVDLWLVGSPRVMNAVRVESPKQRQWLAVSLPETLRGWT